MNINNSPVDSPTSSSQGLLALPRQKKKKEKPIRAATSAERSRKRRELLKKKRVQAAGNANSVLTNITHLKSTRRSKISSAEDDNSSQASIDPCQCCFKEMPSSETEISQKKQIYYVGLINTCFSVKIQLHPDIKFIVCDDCNQRLNESFNLKYMILDTQAKIISMHPDNKEDCSVIKKERNDMETDVINNYDENSETKESCIDDFKIDIKPQIFEFNEDSENKSSLSISTNTSIQNGDPLTFEKKVKTETVVKIEYEDEQIKHEIQNDTEESINKFEPDENTVSDDYPNSGKSQTETTVSTTFELQRIVMLKNLSNQMPDGKRKRCFMCPSQKDKKTKTSCSLCHKNVCGNHSQKTVLCINCL